MNYIISATFIVFCILQYVLYTHNNDIVIYNKGYNAAATILRGRSCGSAFLITPTILITNSHVVRADGKLTKDTDRISVTTNFGTFEGTIIKDDPSVDLAAIRIRKWPGLENNILNIAEASPVIGSTIYSVGSERCISNTFHKGVVTNEKTPPGTSRKVMLTNSQINHGDSGSAILNDRGQVVAVNVQLINDSSIRVGIYLDTLKEFIKGLK